MTSLTLINFADMQEVIHELSTQGIYKSVRGQSLLSLRMMILKRNQGLKTFRSQNVLTQMERKRRIVMESVSIPITVTRASLVRTLELLKQEYFTVNVILLKEIMANVNFQSKLQLV